ncbi:MAG: AAA family ATPase, partial [Caldilineaceae bacterium]|nr:AAA family ATPase [Caldilineaceae bacterium]
MNLPLKLPYAIRDFEKLITEDYYYVDRTDHIRVMEQLGSELLLLRPRRFGKSLWLSTLMNYYDLAKAEDFDRLFGKLAIGQNPTGLQNRYLVMRWDFSQVQSHGTSADVEQALHDHINVQIEKFHRYYRAFLADQSTLRPDNAL